MVDALLERARRRAHRAARAARARAEGRVQEGARGGARRRATCARASTARGSSSTTPPKLARYKRHDIDVVIDRLTVEPRGATRAWPSRSRPRSSSGTDWWRWRARAHDDRWFSQGAACPKLRHQRRALEPRSFSFNSPYGACRTCDGLGTQLDSGSGARRARSRRSASPTARSRRGATPAAPGSAARSRRSRKRVRVLAQDAVEEAAGARPAPAALRRRRRGGALRVPHARRARPSSTHAARSRA